MSQSPGKFQARQILLAERAKRHTTPAATAAPSPHPSLQSMTAVEPLLSALTMFETHDDDTAQFIFSSGGVLDFAARLALYPLFVSCCLLTWLRYELRDYDFAACYYTGERWCTKGVHESDRLIWFLMLPTLPLRLLFRALSSPVVWLVKDNEKKRSAFQQGRSTKKPCPYTSATVDGIYIIISALYTICGIHLTIIKLCVGRFADTEGLWYNLKTSWWTSVMGVVNCHNTPFVGNCLLTPD